MLQLNKTSCENPLEKATRQKRIKYENLIMGAKFVHRWDIAEINYKNEV